MKRFNLLFLLIVILSSCKPSFNPDPATVKKADGAIRMLYQFSSPIFKNKGEYSKIDDSYMLPWEATAANTNEQLLSAVDSLKANAKLKLVSGNISGSSLNLKTNFPANIKDVGDIFELNFSKSNIKNASGDLLEFRKTGSVSLGSNSVSGFKNGKNYAYDWVTINASFGQKDKQSVEGAAGSGTFMAKFIGDYKHTKVSAKDIGKKITLDGASFEVADIFDNKMILSPKEGAKFNSRNIKFVNMDDNGHKIAAVSFAEMSERKKKDPSLEFSMSGLGSGTTTLNEKALEVFKKNPNISEDDFVSALLDSYSRVFSSDDPREAGLKYLGPKLTVLHAAGPIQNIYLYTPVYSVKKEFEVPLSAK